MRKLYERVMNWYISNGLKSGKFVRIRKVIPNDIRGIFRMELKLGFYNKGGRCLEITGEPIGSNMLITAIVKASIADDICKNVGMVKF